RCHPEPAGRKAGVGLPGGTAGPGLRCAPSGLRCYTPSPCEMTNISAIDLAKPTRNGGLGCRIGEATLTKTIRGVSFEDNLDNAMGLQFYNLSHRFGYQSPNWPYFEDVKIERIHYMAKSGVLSQRITTSMHNTTHIDAPAHVIQGTPFIDEVP